MSRSAWWPLGMALALVAGSCTYCPSDVYPCKSSAECITLPSTPICVDGYCSGPVIKVRVEGETVGFGKTVELVGGFPEHDDRVLWTAECGDRVGYLVRPAVERVAQFQAMDRPGTCTIRAQGSQSGQAAELELTVGERGGRRVTSGAFQPGALLSISDEEAVLAEGDALYRMDMDGGRTRLAGINGSGSEGYVDAPNGHAENARFALVDAYLTLSPDGPSVLVAEPVAGHIRRVRPGQGPEDTRVTTLGLALDGGVPLMEGLCAAQETENNGIWMASIVGSALRIEHLVGASVLPWVDLTARDLSGACALVVESDQRLVVAAGSVLARVATQRMDGGVEVTELNADGGFARGALQNPVRLERDRFGHVYLADLGTGAVYVLLPLRDAPSGLDVVRAAVFNPSPSGGARFGGLAVTPAGDILITRTADGEVWRY